MCAFTTHFMHIRNLNFDFCCLDWEHILSWPPLPSWTRGCQEADEERVLGYDVIYDQGELWRLCQVCRGKFGVLVVLNITVNLVFVTHSPHSSFCPYMSTVSLHQWYTVYTAKFKSGSKTLLHSVTTTALVINRIFPGTMLHALFSFGVYKPLVHLHCLKMPNASLSLVTKKFG